MLWQRFRALESIERQIELANVGLEPIKISFGELTQVFLAVQSKSNIDIFLPQTRDGVGTFDAAQVAICSIVQRYCLAWEQQGVLLMFE
jgi:hypothetical protein